MTIFSFTDKNSNYKKNIFADNLAFETGRAQNNIGMDYLRNYTITKIRFSKLFNNENLRNFSFGRFEKRINDFCQDSEKLQKKKLKNYYKRT